MTVTSSGAPAAPDDQRNEVSGRLKIDGDRKTGVYGAFWNVTIIPDDDLPPVQATLSEKVWARLGIPPPVATTDVRVKARRNTNGRWNVIHVDTGPSELKNALTTVVQLEQAGRGTDSITSYRFRLLPQGCEPFETRVPGAALAHFGILSLPVNQALICDWTRVPWVGNSIASPMRRY